MQPVATSLPGRRGHRALMSFRVEIVALLHRTAIITTAWFQKQTRAQPKIALINVTSIKCGHLRAGNLFEWKRLHEK